MSVLGSAHEVSSILLSGKAWSAHFVQFVISSGTKRSIFLPPHQTPSQIRFLNQKTPTISKSMCLLACLFCLKKIKVKHAWDATSISPQFPHFQG